mmetsp:Transcript_28595/g.91216  ORF Transcript_28595/g.91216 Transcript_28595/m.91216 type:complete len:294 (-) Transcript_28595:1872-2753(-)|eukprot:scaffold15002_cov131-Isochrysis_galbana.AAC.9
MATRTPESGQRANRAVALRDYTKAVLAPPPCCSSFSWLCAQSGIGPPNAHLWGDGCGDTARGRRRGEMELKCTGKAPWAGPQSSRSARACAPAGAARAPSSSSSTRWAGKTDRSAHSNSAVETAGVRAALAAARTRGVTVGDGLKARFSAPALAAELAACACRCFSHARKSASSSAMSISWIERCTRGDTCGQCSAGSPGGSRGTGSDLTEREAIGVGLAGREVGRIIGTRGGGNRGGQGSLRPVVEPPSNPSAVPPMCGSRGEPSVYSPHGPLRAPGHSAARSLAPPTAWAK